MAGTSNSRKRKVPLSEERYDKSDEDGGTPRENEASTSKSRKSQVLLTEERKNKSKDDESASEDDTSEDEDDTSEDEEDPPLTTQQGTPAPIKAVKINPLNKISIHKKGTYGVVFGNRGKERQFEASSTVLKEIKRLQSSTKLLFPRGPFARIIREITKPYGEFKYQSLALDAIQEAAELFLIGYISDSYQLTRHRKRETLAVQDTQLLCNLLKDFIPSLHPI